MRQFKNVTIVVDGKGTHCIYLSGVPKDYFDTRYVTLARNGVYLYENVDVSFTDTQTSILATDKSKVVYTIIKNLLWDSKILVDEEEAKNWNNIFVETKKSFFTRKIKTLYYLTNKSWKLVTKKFPHNELILPYKEMQING